jgi:hypothetical protein
MPKARRSSTVIVFSCAPSGQAAAMGGLRQKRKRPGLRPHLFHAGEDASGPREKSGMAIQVDAGLGSEIELPPGSAVVRGPEVAVPRYFRSILSPLRAALRYLRAASSCFRVIPKDLGAAPK